MANKIKLIRLDGNDILSKSMETINQNYNLLEETINSQIENSVDGLKVRSFNWETGTDAGPKGRITLSNDNTMTTESIPVADKDQSGIITARTNQTISGVKRFTDGIKTDSIYSENGRKFVIASGNRVYIGGEGGIILEYSGNTLTNIIYGFSENGTTPGDIASQISSLQQLINNNTTDITSFNEALQNIINQYNSELQRQAGQLDMLASALADLDFSDVREQLDGMIEHWFGPYEKMASLLSSWGATVNMHVGDTFTVTEPVPPKVENPYYKKCYKLRTDGSSYQWIEMNEDEYDAVIKSLLNTLDAISIADGKCTTFYSEVPPVPCHVGDIWITKEPFYLEGESQNFNVEGIDDSDDIDVIPAQTIYFCIKDNETEYGKMSDWNKDIKTWAQIQFEKEVGKQFEITNEAIESVADALDAINNDNIFSVFEKHDFLDHTWYLIAGGYNYIPSQGSITNGIPSSDFLGTTMGGSFRNTIKEYIGDNETISDTTDINELVTAFRNLGNWLMTNHLFDDQLDDTDFVITDTNDYTTVVEYTGDDIGRKAKQQLAELLYNYYREEGECKKKAYVNAVTSMLYDLDNQEDNMIQNWFRNGVPEIQADMPWRKDSDDSAEYTIIDNMHISDTLVDLSSVERPVYKFCRRDYEDATIGEDDRAVSGTLFYWMRIGKSDLQQIIDQLNIDMTIAGGDGTINVFNTLPNNYSYGDIWFCRENWPEAPANPEFKAGCIYYCSATDFEDGSDSDNERDLVRRYFHAEDWSNGYQQGEEIYSMFANMMSDGVLSPIEKSQIFMEWYEIGGFNLMGNDSELYDEIVEDVFLDDASNTGSFRCTVNNASKLLRNNQTVESYSDFNTFLSMDFDGTKHTLVQTISSLKTKLERLHSALVQCKCNDTSTSTNLSELTFAGLGSPYDGHWNTAVHITMIPDLFSQYYLEEDNVKTLIQSIQAEELQDQIDDLGDDIDDINDIIGEVQNSIEAIEAINDDNKFSIYEKKTLLENTWLMIAGSKTYSPSTDVSGYTTVSGVSVPDTDPTSIGNFLGTTTNGSFINTMNMCKGDRGFNNDDVKQCIGKLITAFKALGNWCNGFGLFDTPLSQSNWNATSDKQTLANLLYNYYNAEDECKRIGYVDAVTSLIQDLNGQGGENGDHMIQNWFGTVIPSSQGALPWRIASEQAADLNENDLKHKNDTFVHIIDGITEVYKFLEGTADTQNGDKGISGSPLYLKKIASADYQHIYDNLGIDTELAGADGSIIVFDTLPHDYTYGDIWFCGADWPEGSTNPTFKSGCIYYCSDEDITTPKTTFDPDDWSAGYSYADSFISQFTHFTSDNWLTQIEKDQLLSKWHEIAGVDIFGNDSSLPAATLSDIFNNGVGGSFRSAVNLCTQLYDDVNSVGTYSAYDSFKTRVTEDYPELGTLITTLESKLTDVRNVLIACNCHIEGEQDLTTLSFSFTEASINTYNGTWNSNKNGSMFSEIFTRYYLAESNVREKVQLIQNTNLQEQIDGFDARIDTAEDAIERAESAINAINDDNIFSISEKNSFLTNTFLPISGNRAYDTSPSADVNYTTIGSTSCPESRPTQISDFLGTSQNGSFIKTIDSVWPSTLTEVSNNVKVRVGELVSAYKNLAKLCKNNGLFDEHLTSTQFRNSSNDPVDGPTGKSLLSTALYNYKREENECNKLLYIDSVSNMISSLTNQLDGQVKRYYKNSTPPSTTDGCSMLFGCDQSEFESHLNDEYIDTSSNNDVYLFVKKDDISETVSNPNIDVENTLYYWKKVSNSSLQNLIDRIDGFEQTLAQNDGVINIFNTVPGGNKPYSYGDIWFCNSDYTSGNKTFEKDHMYWCFDTTAQNVTTFNPNQWKSAYPYGDDMLAQLAHITDDNYVSTIEKSSLIQKWCEITGGNDVPVSLNMSVIMNDSTNVGSFRSVINDWYSSFNTNSLNYSNYDNVSQNSSSPHRSVVVDLVKKLNDVRKALELCGCVGENATEGTSVNGLNVPSGAFQYSGNMDFNGHLWSNSILPTVFATYYFEETNLRTLVQQYNTQQAATAAQTAAMDYVDDQLDSIGSSITDLQNQINSQAGQGTTPVANDNEFTVSEKTEFLHNTWQTIAGSLTYVSGNDGSSYISNGKLTGEYLGTSSSNNGSFRTILKDIDGFTISGGKVTNTGHVATLITKFKDLAAECDYHKLFEPSLYQTEFPAQGQPHDIDDLYDALYEYYNAEEALRQHNYSEDYSNVMAALNNQTDSVIRTHYASGTPPTTVDNVLRLWKTQQEVQAMSSSEKTSEMLAHNFDEYTDLTGPVAYLLITDGSVSYSSSNEDDINITGENNYFWKKTSQSSINDIISQFDAAYNAAIAQADGFIQVFGPEKVPSKYDYGDIWFFGGADAITDSSSISVWNNLSSSDKNRFVTGNIYYCNYDYDDNDVENVTFRASDWVVGSNSGSLTTQLTQMTSDGWMTYSEKYVLRQKWYEITGFEFGTRSFNSFEALKNFFSNNTNLTNGTFKQAKLQYDNIISEYGGSEPGGGNSGGNSGGSEAPADPSGGETGEGEQNENIQGMLDGIFINDGNGSIGTDVLNCEKSEIDGEYHLTVKDDDDVLRVLCSYQRGDEYIVENDGSDLKSITMFDFDENNDETFAKYVTIFEIRFVNNIENCEDTIRLEDIFAQGDISVNLINPALEVVSESGKLKSYIYGENGLCDVEDTHKLSISIGDNGYDMYVCVDFNDGNSGALNIQNVENCLNELYDDIWNIYKVMTACGCSDMQNPTNLHTNVPGGLKSPFNAIPTSHYIYEETHVNDHRTLVADVFTQYYTDEQALYVEMTDYEISNIEVEVDPLEGLAEEDGSLILTSYIKLKYNGNVTGGLSGVNVANEDLGLWLGGSYADANADNVPINLKRTGYGSTIGPLKVGVSSSNKSIYIGDNSSDNNKVTVISENYISLGTKYGDFEDDASDIDEKSMIYLSREGVGSRIGPLVVGGDTENKTILFGNTRRVYRFCGTSTNNASNNLTTNNQSVGDSGISLGNITFKYTTDHTGIAVTPDVAEIPPKEPIIDITEMTQTGGSTPYVTGSESDFRSTSSNSGNQNQ